MYMKATIWIRVENEGKWRAIKDKSAWVNSYLKVADIQPKSIDPAAVTVATPEAYNKLIG